jgi:hypothetical protein
MQQGAMKRNKVLSLHSSGLVQQTNKQVVKAMRTAGLETS